MNTSNKISILIISILTLIILSLSYCNHRTSQELKFAEKSFSEDLHKVSTFVNKQGEIIKYQDQKITSKEQAVRLGLLDIAELKANNLKSIQSQVKLKERIAILNKEILFNNPVTILDTVEIDGSIDTSLYLRTPIEFNTHDSIWYFLSGTVTAKSIIIDSLTMFSMPSITYAIKRADGLGRFFKKPYPIVYYKNENPYALDLQMENIVIKDKPRWYERKSFLIGLGFLAGAFIVR